MTREPWQSIDPASADDLDALAEHLDIRIWKAGDGAVSTPRLVGRSMRESLADRLPPRYATDSWRVPYDRLLQASLRPGMRILDVGAGSLPVLTPEQRPADCEYVGLDVEREELEKAAPGSYDAFEVADATVLVPALEQRFDLILSWLTMEHVADVPAALENLRRYLVPGGRCLAYLAGSNAVHAVLNRVVPAPVAKVAMRRLIGRDPDTVFKAHYDSCTYTELSAIAERWADGRVTPVFTGGWYLRFSRHLRAPYLGYEEWAFRRGHRDLATYYIFDATA